jgi:hypothetical protein
MMMYQYRWSRVTAIPCPLAGRFDLLEIEALISGKKPPERRLQPGLAAPPHPRYLLGHLELANNPRSH